MPLLRVILLELFARLADLLDHEVVRVTLNDPFDGVVLVSRNDDEAESLLNDSFVFSRGERQLLDA